MIRALLSISLLLSSSFIIIEAKKATMEPAPTAKANKVAEDGVIEITSGKQFKKIMDEAKKKEMPVVLKVYATWCGPCKMSKKPFEELAIEHAGKGTFLALDSDTKDEDLIAVMEEFEVKGLPSFVYIQGEAFDVKSGFSKDRLTQEVKKHVSAPKKNHAGEHKKEQAKEKSKVQQDKKPVSKDTVVMAQSGKEYKNILADAKKNKQAVIVKMSADWCGACKLAKEPFKKLAQKFGDDAVFVEIDVDTQDGDLQKEIKAVGIRGVPTFMYIVDGKTEQKSGFHSQERLEKDICEHISSTKCK